MKDTAFTMRMTKQQRKKLARIAELEHRTIANLICHWIEKYPEKNEQEKRNVKG